MIKKLTREELGNIIEKHLSKNSYNLRSDWKDLNNSVIYMERVYIYNPTLYTIKNYAKYKKKNWFIQRQIAFDLNNKKVWKEIFNGNEPITKSEQNRINKIKEELGWI